MKNKQGITIAALIIAIVGLSIGFAAFANTLTISSSASVNPSDENFIVQFSKYQDSDATGTLNPITPTALTSDYGENGLIPDSNKKSLQDLKATFTAPGQSVTYELYVRNTGAYVAYLKDLSFANAEHATGSETYKHCYAATIDSNNQSIPAAQQATPSLVSAACEGISVSVTIGTASNITPESASKSLGNQALSANGGYVSASVTITYAANAAYVDGPMEVEFGDISFTASSNPAVEQQGGNEQGGQEEPSQVAGTLIPTDEELEAMEDDDGDPVVIYSVLLNNDIDLSYREYGTAKFVVINIEGGQDEADTGYLWICDSDSASLFGEFDANVWYNADDTGMPSTTYTGPSPINKSDFTIEDVNIESYVDKVIASFSNNNS